jgi:hypothetical protein
LTEEESENEEEENLLETTKDWLWPAILLP